MSLELSREDRAMAIERIRTYFREERDDDMGDLAAGLILDFFLEEVGILIYNRAIGDAEYWFGSRWADLQADLLALKKRKR